MTGVQTCALPILPLGLFIGEGRGWLPLFEDPDQLAPVWEALADQMAGDRFLRTS